MVRECFEPGKTLSMVPWQHGMNPNQPFQWRKLFQDGSLSAVSAGEEPVPASGLSDALKQIKDLQRLLGKKTMENELLREAVKEMKSRKCIARSPSLPDDTQ
jgi:transposase